MSIIRENQLRQIREEDNRLRKIVFEREKRGIKDYEENIKPPQVIDTKIVDENSGKTRTFLDYLNNLYIRLNLIENNQAEFINIFRNTKDNEYRKFRELINIVKPFNLWDDLIKVYINPATNEMTREEIRGNIQKLTPFLKKNIEYLFDNIEHFTAIFECDILKDDVVKNYNQQYEDGTISERRKDQLIKYYKYILNINMYERIYDGKFDEDDPANVKDLENLKLIDAEVELAPFIEITALLQLIDNEIEKGSLKPITKQDVAYEIAQVINKIYTKFGNADLNNRIIKLFKGTTLPELAPFFRNGYGDFTERFNELDAMAGLLGEEKEPEEEPEEPEEGIPDLLLPEAYENPEARRVAERRMRAEERQRLEERRRRPPTPDEEDQDVIDAREYAGEGKPKGRRRANKKKFEKTSKPAIAYNDENNEMFYNPDDECY